MHHKKKRTPVASFAAGIGAAVASTVYLSKRLRKSTTPSEADNRSVGEYPHLSAKAMEHRQHIDHPFGLSVPANSN
jgi:hypothetical protein